MISHRSCALLGIAVCQALPGQGNTEEAARPVAAHVERLLVCNKADHSLSIFDPGTRREVAVVQTGEGPHEVAVSPNGRTAVVTDYGAQKPGSTLTVVDVVEGKALRTIELSYADTDANVGTRQKNLLRPHGIQFVAADRIVFTSESARRLVLF
ncbi:MAG: hypothetical protein ABIP94_00895, partial [Planctomycetota bacterium]